LCAVVNAGYDVESSQRGYDLAKKFERVYCAIGIHPHDAKNARTEDYELFTQLSKDKKVVAYGEIGLDYFYDKSPRDVQEKAFLQQLDLADFLKKPVVLHVRDAYPHMLKLLSENKGKLSNGIVLHCYAGSKELVREFLRYDAYFAFGGAVTFKNAKDKPDIIRSVPIKRLLLETDCPYMTPHPYRGQVNYPKFVSLVADKVAEILGKTRQEIEDLTTANAKEFFRLNDLL